MSDLPEPTWSGSFRLFGVEVKCHVLDNGERIIEADSMHELLEAMAEGSESPGDVEAFTLWQQGPTDWVKL